ncbi:MAG TPA: protein kinase, partial [Thermoanaerobaculia bacterium]|nr:protein kinase [Thermoanaerobaculia bacterium]
EGSLPNRKVLDIGAQIADGLAAAHERGIVHRDLKLDNVMVTRDGRVKLLDFGLAKVFGDSPLLADAARPTATRAGQIWGTPGYMAPEQINGEAVDYRADQFALGVILYELIAGRRPFGGGNPFEAMTAIVRDEPVPLATAAPQVPGQVAWVVERLLAKAPEERYHSTRDLARDLARLRDVAPRGGAASGGTSHSGDASGVVGNVDRVDSTTGATIALRPPRRTTGARWRLSPLAAILAAVLLIAAGAALGWWLRRPAPTSPPSLQALTYSGSDSAADVSPDGRLVAFVSERDGQRRIWLKQLRGGSEAPLTAGIDEAPRFSPDGGQVLFSRFEGGNRVLYRTAVVGGEERRLVANANAGDWSPDGRRIVFSRNRDDTNWDLVTADAEGGDERRLLSVATNSMGSPAWSPDGQRIVVVTGVSLSGAPSQIHFVDAKTGAQTVAPAGPVLGVPAAPAWLADSRGVLVAKAHDVRSFHGAIMRVGLDGTSRPLFASLNVGPSVTIAGPGKVVFDATSARTNLHEHALPNEPVLGGGDDRWLTRGHALDRQPRYSPDGSRVIFSSNRSGNLDLWELERTSGALRRLTDSPQEDWDPAYVGDGSRIVWSSRRGGNLEIWTAAADGSGARQVTHDGVDAENPSTSPDGRWITYTSLNPAHRGIWRAHADGSGAVNLVPGDHGLSEISPDGKYVLFRTDPGPTSFGIRAVRLADGAPVPGFVVEKTVQPAQIRGVVQGRARWLPDGSAVAFIAADERNVTGVWVQDFVPGKDTRPTLRQLAGFDLPWGSESFAFSPDGKRLAIATGEQTTGLVMAEGVAGIE